MSVTCQLIPQVDIGLSAIGDIASSTVFLNLDASMDLTVASSFDLSDASSSRKRSRCCP